MDINIRPAQIGQRQFPWVVGYKGRGLGWGEVAGRTSGAKSYLATKLDLDGEDFTVCALLQVNLDMFPAQSRMCPTGALPWHP